MLARPFGRFNPWSKIRYVNPDENTKYSARYLW
jgi:hypothetical protein